MQASEWGNITEVIQKTISMIIRDILERLMGGNLGSAKLPEQPKTLDKKKEETASPRLWNDHNCWLRGWSISKDAQHKLRRKVASTTSTAQPQKDDWKVEQ